MAQDKDRDGRGRGHISRDKEIPDFFSLKSLRLLMENRFDVGKSKHGAIR